MWEAEGYNCAGRRRGRLVRQLFYSTLDAERIRDMTREADAAKSDAVIFYCTNMLGAPLVDELEQGLVCRSMTHGFRCRVAMPEASRCRNHITWRQMGFALPSRITEAPPTRFEDICASFLYP